MKWNEAGEFKLTLPKKDLKQVQGHLFAWLFELVMPTTADQGGYYEIKYLLIATINLTIFN